MIAKRIAVLYTSLLVLALIVPASAVADVDVFPLGTGTEWAYKQPPAPEPDLFHTVTGPVEFYGESTIAMEQTVSAFGESNTVTIYYSETPGGGIQIHGSSAYRSLSPDVLEEHVFTPPRVLFGGPLSDGASWSGEHLHEVYEDGVLQASWTTQYEVMVTEPGGPLTVPAGEFQTFEVTLSADNWEEVYWLASGVGIVKKLRRISGVESGVYELHSGNLAVRADLGSIGLLKGAFQE